MASLESALFEMVIHHGDPAATTLIRWLVTSEHPAGGLTVDLAWSRPDTPIPFR